MDFDSKILFFFGALGAFNGIIAATYFLFFSKSRNLSSRLMGLFLLVLSIRTGKSIFYHYTEELPDLFLLIALIAFFFIGPLSFFYLLATIRQKLEFIKSTKTHLVILIPLVLVLGTVYNYSDEPWVWKNFVVDFVYLVWFIYTVLSFLLVLPLLQRLQLQSHKSPVSYTNALVIFFINLIAFIGSLVGHFTMYIIGAYTFTAIIYLCLSILIFSKNGKVNFFSNIVAHQRNSLISKNIDHLIHELDILMKSEELYRNPQLKSIDVAKKLDITVHQLSELVNVHLSKNFPTLLNEYRVEHAKEIIQSGSNYTLEAIGYESGFNSKSAFYNAFKKVTGTSPSKYSGS